MKILLVEDNPVDRMFVSHSLLDIADFNCELVHCVSLAQAIQYLSTSTFDVILLDLSLPDSEGIETCQRIVSTVRGTPIVIMTGTDDRALASEAMRRGAQDYLVKGAFPGSAIARVLQYAIDRFHFHRELAQREDYFKQVLSHVPAIIWTTDCDLTITSAVGAGLREVALDSVPIVGKSIVDYMSQASEPDAIMGAHMDAASGNSASLESNCKGRVFEVKIDPLYDAEVGVVGTIGIALDVTERRNLDREIGFARLIQEGLLPSSHPCLKGFDIYGGSFPAKQTCGDWFDYLMFADGSVGLVVGDVSGKGFGPAILSATMAAYLEVLAENHTDIQQILTLVNRLVCRRGLDGQFTVLSLGRLRAEDRSLIYGGAGEEILIVGCSGELKHRVHSSGLPLGVMEDALYEPATTVSLESGDVLLFLTDGFREAMNSRDVLFGVSRVVESIAANRDGSAMEIFQALRQSAHDFADGHNQLDDMTGVVVKVLG